MADKKKKNNKKKKKVTTKVESNMDNLFDYLDTDPLTTNFEDLDESGFQHKVVPAEDLYSDTYRTITVVAESVSWYDKDSVRQYHKMEPGRMAAQVGHVVSKLKLSYILESKDTDKTNLVEMLHNLPITSIVLKARDSKELDHIIRLCEDKNIHTVEFHDDNRELYGNGTKVLSAIAIGPVEPHNLSGITDYLPLWTDSNNSANISV